ncbi:helix-turn-helix domain-containing protein [Amaricoccus tamworthensis]|uniref:helix-turn-helix domain-containing protein n=1 Tax=Amaricoccus tamworthensis TaxID=57002 RepID=UPI003C7C2248
MNVDSPTSTLGRDLRALRKSRGMTLEAVAKALGKSVGWISQVERDISNPEISALREFAELYQVPMSLFFGSAVVPSGEEGRIVRAAGRRRIGEGTEGFVEELLSPDLTDSFEVIHSSFSPGAKMMDGRVRPTQEVVYMVSGKLDVWIGEAQFTVGAGDSFRVKNERLRWANPYSETATTVWVISPPVY